MLYVDQVAPDQIEAHGFLRRRAISSSSSGERSCSSTRWTSSGSADPLKTRLTNSRTMSPITCRLRLRRPVNVGAVGLVLLEVLLLLQDLHHGHDRGVGDLAPLEQRFVDVADRDAVALPDDLHDFQFLLGEGRDFAVAY